jgi:hypothetical protein
MLATSHLAKPCVLANRIEDHAPFLPADEQGGRHFLRRGGPPLIDTTALKDERDAFCAGSSKLKDVGIKGRQEQSRKY